MTNIFFNLSNIIFNLALFLLILWSIKKRRYDQTVFYLVVSTTMGMFGFQFIGPNISASILGAGLGYSTMFVVSGSMALVAMVLYMGIFAYMHSLKRVQAAEAEAA